MTPEQVELFSLIQQLPTHDSRLSVAEIASEQIKAKEKAVEAAAKALAEKGALANFLESRFSDADANLMSVRFFLQEIKRYQLTDDGTLLSKSKARVGIKAVPDHQEQRAAFEAAADFSKQDDAVRLFLKKLKENPKAQSLFDEPKQKIFDIGYGNGAMSAKIAKTFIDNGIPVDNIEFHGLDLVPGNAPAAKQALLSAGLPENNIKLIGGMVGFDNAQLPDGTANLALDLESDQAGKHNIVTAINVNNFGNKEKFLRQVDGALRDEGIAIFQHDVGGDLLEFKKQCSESGKVYLRNAESISGKIAGEIETSGHKSSDFEVPYSITFPGISDTNWNAMKNVPTGVFNKPYEDDIDAAQTYKDEYKKQRLLVEFCLGEPLGAFTKDERTYVLDRFRKLIDDRRGELSGTAAMQIMLSREHSRELAEAVEEAARSTGKELAPNLEAARSAVQSRGLGG